MTVLSPAKGKAAAVGFPINGPYSYITLLLDFAEWGVDLPWVRMRIARLKSGDDFAGLFRDILVASGSRATWHHHSDARRILMRHFETMAQSWDTVLSLSPDRSQLTLEYLADALKSIGHETTLH